MQPSRKATSALILEDEPRYRDFLEDVLRGMDCSPVSASNAEQAMKLVQTSPPDMLLLDLNLPRVDGMTFLERFRGRCPETPVVVITGFGDLESARKAIRFGVTDFLTKPCDLGQIEQAIDRALRRLDKPVSGRGEVFAAAEPEREVRSLEQVERGAIMDALRLSGGNRSEAARRLGISRRALYDKIARYRESGHEVP